MRFAIADPPYLGRADRWYGDGTGHGRGHGRADYHPDAMKWDSPRAHVSLLDDIQAFDGWAIAMHESSLSLYLSYAPEDAHVGVWVRGNAIPTGSRVRALWEPVLYRIPPSRRGRGEGAGEDDVLSAGITHGGFVGRKPEAWTHWLLRLLGVRLDLGDEVSDLFPGSGAVSDALASYPSPLSQRRRIGAATEAQLQQLRRVARATKGKRAPVLAALRAGASVRAVAAEARISTNTVQRWKREAQVTASNGHL